MIDIITVVFDEEISILKTQAQSINQYIDYNLINQIYVVINDKNLAPDQIDTAWWGEFQDRVVILSCRTFVTKFDCSGWHSQQLLKLLTSAISYTPWSLILDAKTLFVKSLTAADLFDSQGRPCIGGTLPVQSVFAPSQQAIQDLFNIKLQNQLAPAGVPFVINNQLTRRMITTIEQQVDQSFVNWFQLQPDVTEFLLYSGFILQQYSTYDFLYNIDKAAMRAVNVAHTEVNQFGQLFKEMLLPHTSTVSIHRWAWRDLTAQQQQQYRDFLTGRGLTCEL
jgi:hypothetical protein